MVDLKQYADEQGYIPNPFAAKTEDGEWIEGSITLEYLESNFNSVASLDEMSKSTESEGLKLLFDSWIKK